MTEEEYEKRVDVLLNKIYYKGRHSWVIVAYEAGKYLSTHGVYGLDFYWENENRDRVLLFRWETNDPSEENFWKSGAQTTVTDVMSLFETTRDYYYAIAQIKDSIMMKDLTKEQQEEITLLYNTKPE